MPQEHRSGWDDWKDPWEDRVAGDDEALGQHAASGWAKDAAEFAEVIVECALKPIMAMAASMPRIIEVEFAFDRHRRHGRRKHGRGRHD